MGCNPTRRFQFVISNLSLVICHWRYDAGLNGRIKSTKVLILVNQQLRHAKSFSMTNDYWPIPIVKSAAPPTPFSPQIRIELEKVAKFNRPNLRGEGEQVVFW